MLFKKFLNLFKKKQDLDKIVSEVTDQVWNQVRNQVWNRVWFQFRSEVAFQVMFEVESQVKYRISKIRIPSTRQIIQEIKKC